MKKFLSLFLSIVIAIGIVTGIPAGANGLALSVNAAGSEDLVFSLINNNSEYAVTDCATTATGDLVIPATYNDLPVTSIYSSAFRDCISLNTIVIPDGVKTISSYAFYGCTGLKNVTIGDDVTSIGESAFQDCTSLGSVVIGDSVSSIGKSAFYGCISLTSITIGKGLKSIASNAFYDCTSLKAVYIEDLANWCKITFNNNPLYYAGNLYLNGELVTELVIPEGTTTVSSYSFQKCTSITKVTVGNNVTDIGAYAFSDCDNVTDVIIGDNVINIYDEAFYSCDKLKNVKIGNGVTTIGTSAFSDCENLSSVTIGNGVTTINSWAFSGCKSLGSVTIPTSVKTIGSSAFRECTALNTIVIPHGVKTISSYAFYGCTGLKNVTVGDDVTSIGESAFQDCTSLGSVVIGDSVSSIGKSAFYSCSKLSDVFYNGCEELWNAISIGSYNTPLTNARKHFNTSTPHYGAGEILVKPTCTESGTIKYSCSCGYEKTETLSPLGHDYNTEWTIDKEATCMETGIKSHYCLRCGNKTDETVIDVSDHTYGEWVVTKPATCKETGSRYKICIHCETTRTETLEIINCDFQVVTASQAHPHTTIYKCSMCETEKTANAYVSDCAACDFTVVAIDSQSYKVTKYIGAGSSKVTIPTEYNNLPITKIENACFKDNKTITSVTISDRVTAIGSLAFMNCSALETVVIPQSVTSIGAQAFFGFKGVIGCFRGSYAQEYAETNSIDYKILDIGTTPNSIIDYDNLLIFTSTFGVTNLEDLIYIPTTTLAISTASLMTSNGDFLGTGSTVTVFEGDNYDYVGDYMVIVNGDLTGDGVCNVLDAFYAEKCSNDHISPDTAQIYAANNCVSDCIDASSYQRIVNLALSA